MKKSCFVFMLGVPYETWFLSGFSGVTAWTTRVFGSHPENLSAVNEIRAHKNQANCIYSVCMAAYDFRHWTLFTADIFSYFQLHVHSIQRRSLESSEVNKILWQWIPVRGAPGPSTYNRIHPYGRLHMTHGSWTILFCMNMLVPQPGGVGGSS